MIPVNVITGYLGAGKTTLLQKIINKKKVAIVLNEFGEIAIDGKIIGGKNIDIVELTGGCVCCSLSGDFELGVKELCERKPERIILETTGLAEPNPVIDSIKDMEGVVLDSVITIVDADSIVRFPSIGKTGEEQIELADIIILNKVDLVRDPAPVKEKIQKMNNAKIVDAKFCDVDVDQLFGIHEEKLKEHEDHEIEDGYFTVKPRKLDHGKFLRFLDNINIYRIKGFVETEKGKFLVNYVAGRYSLEPSENETELVFIGKNAKSLEEKVKKELI